MVHEDGYLHIEENDDSSNGVIYTDNSNKQLFIRLNSTLCELFHSKMANMEWGTFTPTVTLVGGAGNTVPVYSTNSGRYCRIGNIVFVDVLLEGDGGAEGAGTGVINIALPVNGGSNKLDGSLKFNVGTGANGSGPELLTGSITQSGSTIALQRQAGIRSIPDFKGVDQNNSARKIRLHFWYEVD